MLNQERFDHHSKELKERFLKQGYDQKLVDEQLEKVDKLVRDDLLQEKDQEQQDPKRIRFLPNRTAVVRKNWNILQTNKNLMELLQEHPIRAFKRNKNLKEILGSTRIENGKVKKFNISSGKGKCTTCLSGTKTLCCNQVLTTNTLISQQARRTLNIFFNLNCKSEYVIYLMKCILCKKQYVGKAKTAFNLRLNNHRKDTKKPNSILACKHFQQEGHYFNKHAKFTFTDKLVNLATRLQRSTVRNISDMRKFLDSEAENTSSIWT